MASLEIIDEIACEIAKTRGVDIPIIGIKIMVLTYMMYACNTFDVKYENEDGFTMRINGGCILLCQKGTGKSRTMQALKKIFSSIEDERNARYLKAKKARISDWEDSEIPLSKEQEKEIKEFYDECGREVVSVSDDPITAKGLCQLYAQTKSYRVNNILFTVDEAGDRLFRDAFAKDPSISAKEFTQSLNQLFDGYCGMGASKAARAEGIQSQKDVGANFIFVSTPEFLKDFGVGRRFESFLESGAGRRFFYLNCPPIDKLKTSRKRYHPCYDNFQKIANDVFSKKNLTPRTIKVSEELWAEYLEKEGSGCGITIDDEFLLVLFCVVLAVWTGDTEIKPYHWLYMLKTFREAQNFSVQLIKTDTTNYDRVCGFMRDWLEEHSTKKKIAITLIKDFCVRERLCFDNQFRKWFNTLVAEFSEINESKYIIEKNQMYAWLNENFAYEENKK